MTKKSRLLKGFSRSLKKEIAGATDGLDVAGIVSDFYPKGFNRYSIGEARRLAAISQVLKKSEWQVTIERTPTGNGIGAIWPGYRGEKGIVWE